MEVEEHYGKTPEKLNTSLWKRKNRVSTLIISEIYIPIFCLGVIKPCKLSISFNSFHWLAAQTYKFHDWAYIHITRLYFFGHPNYLLSAETQDCILTTSSDSWSNYIVNKEALDKNGSSLMGLWLWKSLTIVCSAESVLTFRSLMKAQILME